VQPSPLASTEPQGTEVERVGETHAFEGRPGRAATALSFRPVPGVPSSAMEAATPLPFTSSAVRVLGDRLAIEGLIVDDECAVRLAREHDDPAKLLLDAIEIGARVLDREQTGANADFVRAEFEKAAQ